MRAVLCLLHHSNCARAGAVQAAWRPAGRAANACCCRLPGGCAGRDQSFQLWQGAGAAADRRGRNRSGCGWDRTGPARLPGAGTAHRRGHLPDGGIAEGLPAVPPFAAKRLRCNPVPDEPALWYRRVCADRRWPAPPLCQLCDHHRHYGRLPRRDRCGVWGVSRIRRSGRFRQSTCLRLLPQAGHPGSGYARTDSQSGQGGALPADDRAHQPYTRRFPARSDRAGGFGAVWKPDARRDVWRVCRKLYAGAGRLAGQPVRTDPPCPYRGRAGRLVPGRALRLESFFESSVSAAFSPAREPAYCTGCPAPAAAAEFQPWEYLSGLMPGQ